MSTHVKSAGSCIRWEEKGHTICVVPDLPSDQVEDDLDLNKSFPCTQRPSNNRSFFALQHRDYPDFVIGKIASYFWELDK